MTFLMTPEQVRDRLSYEGVTIAAFCEKHSLNQTVVSNLLAGRLKGVRGETRRAAILLGMKEGKISEPSVEQVH